MRDGEVRAYIARDVDDYFASNVRLHVVRRGLVEPQYLRADGAWAGAVEGQRMGDDSGLLLPADAVEALGVAVETFLGRASHANTEARVLREWLAVEQERVDRALAR